VPALLLSGAMAMAALGTIAFALARSLELAYAGRFLIGAGSAVGFIGSLALASRWFPPHRFALLAGLAMLIAMIGGFAGQAPLAALINIFGWRATMLASGVVPPDWRCDCAGGAQFAAPRTAPAPRRQNGRNCASGSPRPCGPAKSGSSRSSPPRCLARCWPSAGCGACPIWSSPTICRPQAALLVSMTLVGWALGSPASGWISDHIRRRKAPLVAARRSWHCWSSS
jgi:MFS family permease